MEVNHKVIRGVIIGSHPRLRRVRQSNYYQLEKYLLAAIVVEYNDTIQVQLQDEYHTMVVCGPGAS